MHNVSWCSCLAFFVCFCRSLALFCFLFGPRFHHYVWYTPLRTLFTSFSLAADSHSRFTHRYLHAGFVVLSCGAWFHHHVTRIHGRTLCVFLVCFGSIQRPPHTQPIGPLVLYMFDYVLIKLEGLIPRDTPLVQSDTNVFSFGFCAPHFVAAWLCTHAVI